MSDLRAVMGQPRRTAHEYVRDTVRQAILGGTLRAGTRLVQADLAEQLGVSTTPVREALRDLATEGLLQLDPHHGAVVKQLTYDEIQEIQDLTLVLEPEAMQKVAGVITEQSLQEATQLADEMESVQSTEEMGRWADLNRRFHAILAQDLGPSRLVRILEGLRDGAAPYIGLTLQKPKNQLEAANRDHRRLLAALRERDGEKAAEISAEHVRLTMWVLERSRDVLEPPD